MIKIPSIALLALSLLAFTPLIAQEIPPELSGDGFVKLESSEIPTYEVVVHFYLYAKAKVTDPDSFARLLRKLEMAPGSAAAGRFLDSVFEIDEVLEMRTIDPSKEGEEFMSYQWAAMEEKARALGVVFRSLLYDLAELGYDAEILLTYLEERVRPEIASFTNEDPATSPGFAALRTFDAVLAEEPTQ